MAFEFKITFAAQYIDQDRYVSTLQRELRRLMREAASIYYTNIIFRLPVDTGFLAGSFEPIKKASGSKTNPIFPAIQRKATYYTHFGQARTLKIPTNGPAYTTPEDDVLTEFTDGQTHLRLVFFFKNDIRYYPINDLYGRGKNAPWKITEKAIRVAIAFIQTNLPRIVPAALRTSVKSQLISYRPGQAPQTIRVRT